MYSREYKKQPNSSNNSPAPAVSKFAAPPSFVQPQIEDSSNINNAQHNQDTNQKAQPLASNWPDVSMFTYRPQPATPQIQLKRNVDQLGKKQPQQAAPSIIQRARMIQRADDDKTKAAPAKAAPAATVTADPKIVVKPGTDVDVVAEAAKNPDWATLTARLTDRGLNNPEMVKLCAEYVLAMTANQEAKAKYLLTLINNKLSDVKAFDRRVGDDKNKDYTDKFSLWSGAKQQAEKYADDTGGVSLERSVAGSLFDGLNFGASWSNGVLKHQWNELSRLYASGIRGEVHIHQYRGVRTGSVFNQVEYPTIKDAIALGVVEPVIHLYANWGKYSGLNRGTPVYGQGEKSRKQEQEFYGQAALEKFMSQQWEFGDALEKEGGYWPSGKGGAMIDIPGHSQKVKEGEEW
jgi:hypothetical protein